MKKASDIIHVFRDHPSFRKLKKYECFEKIKALLSPRLQDMVLFMYKRDNILFFVFNHPAAKFEFNSNINQIKRLLYQVQPPECAQEMPSDIRCFVSNKPFKRPEPKKETNNATVPLYKERSMANFQNHIEDKELHKIIEEIRDIIDAKNHPKPS